MAQKMQTHDKQRSLCTDAPSPFWGEGASVQRLQKNACWKEDTWVPQDYALRYPNVERNNLIPTT